MDYFAIINIHKCKLKVLIMKYVIKVCHPDTEKWSVIGTFHFPVTIGFAENCLRMYHRFYPGYISRVAIYRNTIELYNFSVIDNTVIYEK